MSTLQVQQMQKELRELEEIRDISKRIGVSIPETVDERIGQLQIALQAFEDS